MEPRRKVVDMKAVGRVIIALLVLDALWTSAWAGTVDYTVGAYYYPWYYGSGFHGGASIRNHLVPPQQPTLGWYDQSQSSVISSHFLWARSAGIDFFACSYWGKNNATDLCIQNMMFPNPDIGNLKLAVFLETAAITQSKVASETNYLCDNYFKRPGYYRLNNKPVIFIYLTLETEDHSVGMTDSQLAAYTSAIRTAARSKGIGEVYLVGDEVFYDSSHSSVYRLSLLDAITGYDVYGSLHWFFNVTNYASQESIDAWAQQRMGWKALANSANKPFFPVVSPGFNDTFRVTNPAHPPLSRKLGSESGEPGSLFRALIEASLPTSNCNSIMVNSWNEWHEDSQIEPAAAAPPTNAVDGAESYHTDGVYYEGYGNLYLEILRDMTSLMPATPTDLSATNVTPTSMRFTWHADCNNETGFKVYYDLGTSAPVTLRATTAAGDTYYDAAGLSSNVQYSVQLVATSPIGDGFRTPACPLSTLSGPPSVGNNVVCDKSINRSYPVGASFTFSNPAGFGINGTYKVSWFRYTWDTSPTHTWSGNETVWISGTLNRTPTAGDYYLHLRSYNSSPGLPNPTTLDYGPFRVDGTAPVTTCEPCGGVYDGSVSVSLTANEPGAIYYTTDGSTPTTSSKVYSTPISFVSDTTLKFYAVDTVGIAESPSQIATYRVLSESGKIAQIKRLSTNSPVRLGAKHLHKNSGAFGYVQEPDRTSGIRVEGGASTGLTAIPEGSVVSLVGRLQRPVGSECYVILDAITASGSADIRPLGVNGCALTSPLLAGLRVKMWGVVKAGSVAADSFVLSDGATSTGLKIITDAPPGVTDGQFVTVTGVMGFDGSCFASETVAGY